MRIVGGRMRGLKLAELGAGDPAAHLRPTPDRVREAMFNLLVNGRMGDVVQGARVLDLFAGSGALALEALSRGAAEAVLVDDGRAAAALIGRNLSLARAGAEARHLKRDARRLGPCDGAGFDLVFLDPPYGAGLGEAALESALAGGWIAPGAVVVWEESRPPLPPPGLVQRDQRRYGETLVTICEAT
ncbi:16S rRNA (guanine(966)-N(2))-methyltransferase RsmD [Frigidibacter sp. ROC022]|uniref:16S rRNA (guanine(966)-N(2))-methyltransferase RsmD n=1 Tax=Frigidibacter sp. ROC022 TaxID=2971796 RepID=UPI00215AE731|nr:16S rRNA (guanine(966)-N(2))-methyltransferase RsmD [Frigidibacter sp. ROC022]